jgi:hypothetical protein
MHAGHNFDALCSHAGLRQRRNAAAAAMAQGAAGRAADGRPLRRQRVFTLRISTRQLLQIIVFCMVLYQVNNSREMLFSHGHTCR